MLRYPLRNLDATRTSSANVIASRAADPMRPTHQEPEAAGIGEQIRSQQHNLRLVQCRTAESDATAIAIHPVAAHNAINTTAEPIGRPTKPTSSLLIAAR